MTSDVADDNMPTVDTTLGKVYSESMRHWRGQFVVKKLLRKMERVGEISKTYRGLKKHPVKRR